MKLLVTSEENWHKLSARKIFRTLLKNEILFLPVQRRCVTCVILYSLDSKLIYFMQTYLIIEWMIRQVISMRDNLLHRVVVYFVNIADCWQNKWQFIVWMMLVANIPYCLIGVFFFSISAYPHCLFLKQQTIYIVLNVDTVFQTLKISTRNLKSINFKFVVLRETLLESM